MSKELPKTATLSIAFSGLQIIGFILTEFCFHVGGFASSAPSNSAVVNIGFFTGFALFVLLSVPNLCLVVWELLIARKTKEHFWLQYGLASVVIAMWAGVILVPLTSRQGV